MDGQTDGQTDVKTVYPITGFAGGGGGGGIIIVLKDFLIHELYIECSYRLQGCPSVA